MSAPAQGPKFGNERAIQEIVHQNRNNTKVKEIIRKHDGEAEKGPSGVEPDCDPAGFREGVARLLQVLGA